MTYSDFVSDRDGSRVYEYPIMRGRLTYQVNRYLFFRGVVEYNRYRRQLLTDFLASFTYVPGTVVHFGYGSLYERQEWRQDRFVESPVFHEMQRGLFFKMSYLWRVTVSFAFRRRTGVSFRRQGVPPVPTRGF
jgi:hypothetical protein